MSSLSSLRVMQCAASAGWTAASKSNRRLFRPLSSRFMASSSSSATPLLSSSMTRISGKDGDRKISHIVKNNMASSFFSTTTNSEEKDTTITTKKESLEFQAETRQLLDIVTHSLYTDREVFLRELVSNASDALEKLRHIQVSSSENKTIQQDVPMSINITTDEANGTLTISDTGIGLTKEEMIDNLGTIAKSGSKDFIKQLAASGQEGDGGALDASRGIIGKFGVGFYSAFMVGDKVEVRSRSAYEKNSSQPPLVWSSEGVGTYDISDLSPDIKQDRGTSIVIHLKDDFIEYIDEKRIESILKKYSNFVNFPISLNGAKVNTMEAIWSMDPKDIDDEKYSAFYKYIAHAYDDPLDRLHFRADAPLEIKALFYIPSFHMEKHGMGRMDPGVSLYSRKVLIEAKSPDILPEWLRFIKGAVDSEDLPLSISREKAQDSMIVSKLRKVLTRKIINHLTKMARKDPDKYKGEFYKEYAFFLKEGVCQDFDFQDQLSKLLYFETSKTMNGELNSFDEYVARCKPEQKEIYYLCAPSRDLALNSPYLEAFEKAGREVIFVYTAIDDFTMANLEKYEGRSIVSAEKSNIDLGIDGDEKSDKEGDEKNEHGKEADDQKKLTGVEAEELCSWFHKTLDQKVASCKVTNRLDSSPAIVTDNESGAMRRMMRMVDTQEGGLDALPLAKQHVLINPKHPIILGLQSIREKEPTLAKVCAEQVFDNCLVAAGLLDDGRTMLPRLNDILLCVVKGANKDEK
uniref:Histidine kinase/HSP90-like ATPase domain-containing protein n=3 Tax=Ditylum brightwellii TaxID=49249 RepID=A0A6U3SHU6_9STRA|mmetsp:Transcript_31674/g.47213  ORF Transcript_31674/g.47213 Transcript_31674/m.47213 type:complete len:747 (+) Transcript_31674:111-2351(+)